MVIADAVRVLDPPPTIEYLSGDRSQVIAGVPLVLTAYEVDDTEGPVQYVEFFLDGEAEPFYVDNNGSEGWSAVYDTSNLPAGTHSFYAIATDNAQPPDGPLSSAPPIATWRWWLP